MEKDKPLIRPTHDIFGADAEPMRNDETTPPCRLCGKAHVGILSPAYMIVRGNFHHLANEGITVFKPTRKADVMYVEMAGGPVGWGIDIQPGSTTACVVHDVCAEFAARKLRALREVTEEEILYGEYEEEEDEQERLDRRPVLPAMCPQETEESGQEGEIIDP